MFQCTTMTILLTVGTGLYILFHVFPPNMAYRRGARLSQLQEFLCLQTGIWMDSSVTLDNITPMVNNTL